MNSQNRNIIIWLFSIFLLVGFMVMVGGITRLTRSGLSIVEWKPFTGIVPPLSEKSWEAEFEKYKKYPEYIKINQNMTISEFKFIFFWEFMHRFLGRMIGFVFFIPFLYFYLKKYFTKNLLYKTGFAFILGGLQGFMGWFMVKSGLVNIPRVSHYRLASHLLLAFFIMMYVLWIALEIYFSGFNSQNKSEGETSSDAKNKGAFATRKAPFVKLRNASWIMSALIVLQILYGAFTAGIRAGYIYNSFPMMGTRWIPEGLFQMDPFWINLFENMVTVQFLHRYIGYAAFFSIIGFYFYSKRFLLQEFQKKGIAILLILTSVQFLLGVFTLLFAVPISLGVIHQMGAMLLLSAAVYVNFTLTSSLCVNAHKS